MSQPITLQQHQRFESDYVLVTSLFAVLMVLTNVIGPKLFLLLPDLLPSGFGETITDSQALVLTAGLVTYPLTFLLTDVCSEVYGRARANRMVVIGFVASLLMLVVVHISEALPRADRFWSDVASQPLHGSAVVSASEGSQILVDDLAPFADTPATKTASTRTTADKDQAAKAPAVHDSKSSWPILIVASDGSATAAAYHQQVLAEYRADQRGSLVLEQALSVSAGDQVLPAWQIIATAGSDDRGFTRLEWHGPALPTDLATLRNPDGITWAVDVRQQSDGRQQLWVSSESFLKHTTDGLDVGGLWAAADIRGPAQMQQATTAVFAAPLLLLFASMTAYLLAQFVDVGLYHFWRRVTKGKHMWLRNNGSTAISQLLDTIVVNGIFLTFAFDMATPEVTKVIVAGYLVKLVLALLDTPFIYLGVWLAKRRLGLTWRQDIPDALTNHGATAHHG